MKDDTPHQPQHKPQHKPRISVVKEGELLESPLPTRFTMPMADRASNMKLSALMESIRARLDNKEQSSTD